MKILFITAGAAGMYCGSCLRDNALAAELKSRGHDVVLVPLYTPTLTDEPNVSEERVFFGGISVYLQQKVRFFRRAPRAFDRLFDAPWLFLVPGSAILLIVLSFNLVGEGLREAMNPKLRRARA